MFVRFLFVFDYLFNLFRIDLWPSVGKELRPWLLTFAVLPVSEQRFQIALKNIVIRRISFVCASIVKVNNKANLP